MMNLPTLNDVSSQTPMVKPKIRLLIAESKEEPITDYSVSGEATFGNRRVTIDPLGILASN